MSTAVTAAPGTARSPVRLPVVLAVVTLTTVVAGVLLTPPARGASYGEFLTVVAALALLVTVWLLWLLRPGSRPGRQALLLTVGALLAALLVFLRPDWPAFLAVLLVMAGAAVRLPVRHGVPVVLVALLAVSVAEGPGTLYAVPVVAAYVVAAGLLLVAAAYARIFHEGQRRAELLLNELRATAQAQAQAAALDERTMLAREMHDILAHALSGLLLQLEGARLLMERSNADPEALRRLQRAHRLARDGLEEARRAIGALRGDDLPGPELLDQLVADFEQVTGSHASLRVEGVPVPLVPEARLAVYRTTQEALTNAARHALGAEVDVRLHYRSTMLELIVENHPRPAGVEAGAGTSLPVSAPLPSPSPGGGYGLEGMRERAELLGGSLLATAVGSGFLVCLQLPYERAAVDADGDTQDEQGVDGAPPERGEEGSPP